MANVLFAGHAVGDIVIPLMLFHQLQLIACAVLARRYAARGTAPLFAAPPCEKRARFLRISPSRRSTRGGEGSAPDRHATSR